MAVRLYSAGEVGHILGVTRNWVLEHVARGKTPPADFVAVRGKVDQPLWTAASVDQWRAYHAGDASIPSHHRGASYSDHNAVNQVGPVTVTWKLWWRNTHDGGAMWWFSTPQGWYVSDDDGRTWDYADVMVRPGDYHYFSVNGSVIARGAVAAVLRSAAKLKGQLEGSTCSSSSP